MSIRDCEYVYLYTFLTNSTHGVQGGRLDGPIDNVSGGWSYQFADIASLGWSGVLHFKNIYFEAQIKFGRLGGNSTFNAPIVFESCSFGPATSVFNYNPDVFIATAEAVTMQFIGCTFNFSKFMNLVNGGNVSFTSCTFTGYPGLDDDFNKYTSAEITAHNYLCGGVFGLNPPEIHGAINSNYLLSNTNNDYVPYLYTKTVRGKRAVVHQGAERLSYTGNNYPSNFVQLRASKPITFLGKMTDTKNPVIGNMSVVGDTLKFTNLNQDTIYAYTISIGDLIYDRSSATLFVVETVNSKNIAAKVVTNFKIIGGVKEPNAKDKIPLPQDYFILFPCSTLKTDYEYRGDTTAGSNVITNVRRPDGYSGGIADSFKSGDLLFYRAELEKDHAFPQVTRIVSVDATAGTITVDQNATNSIKDFRVAMLA